MNTSRIKFPLLSLLLPLLALTSSCDRAIYDSMEDCPRGVYINVYEQTSCDPQRLYPREAETLQLFAFDAGGTFVGMQEETGVTLSPEYEVMVPVGPAGSYSFVVWAGLTADKFDLSGLTVGRSTKADLLAQLKRANGTAASLMGKRVFVGETPAVAVGEVQNLFPHTEANVREITNRISLKMIGFLTSSNYDVTLSAANTDYSVKGDLLTSESVLYPTEVMYPDERTLTAFYTTLKLDGLQDCKIVLTEKETGKVILEENLIQAIKDSLVGGNINFACDNDFDIEIDVTRLMDGFLGFSLKINGWLIHSYDVDLGK